MGSIKHQQQGCRSVQQQQQQQQCDVSQQGKSVDKSITLRVFNIPKKLHRNGLWFLFSLHGEVVDSFIWRKRSLRHSRFHFVRFGMMKVALTALEILDGFFIYGSRVKVYLARNQSCVFWEKIDVVQELVNASRDSSGQGESSISYFCKGRSGR
ncbi:hypothetical protein V6N11_084125 [Hibiscus sabdariffa]|uniref:RRM domain-containing protein n=1 Tax=Hibiscus sabdariffa TaxID=183260 RepID=A0ABR2QDJ4_9ROSI